MAEILAVGIATLDIVNQVDHYPQEDAEVRATAQYVRRGGNATNTLVVLSQLGHHGHWAGVLADERDSLPILADLENHGINMNMVRREGKGKVPTSYITLSSATASRTIVHYRDLPEYGFDDFSHVNLAPFHWLHFEGRAVNDTAAMLARARRSHPSLPRSVEIEKPRPEIERLFTDADLLLFSRGYARHSGHNDAAIFLSTIQQQAPHALLVCSWGDQGAFALTREGQHVHSPAFTPHRVVDTVGAGDTFNAGFIHASLQQRPLQQRLEFACRLAGRKCGQLGFDELQPDE